VKSCTLLLYTFKYILQYLDIKELNLEVNFKM